MEISRQNYEQYFIDYLDGNLNPDQVEILLSFLEFNPDLKEEFSGMEKICLAPVETIFAGKAKLLRTESALAEADILKDFDMYCISSMENDIDDEDEKVLQGIIMNDPDREDTYSLYRSTRLMPDENIVYPRKANLKKRFIGIPYRILLPAAAAVAVLLILIQVFTGGGHEAGNMTLIDPFPENSREEPGNQALQTQDNAPPANTPIIADGDKSLEATPVQTAFITQKQPVMAEESMTEEGAHSGRENIRLALVKSKSVERIEGLVAIPDQTASLTTALQQVFSPEDQNTEVDPSSENPRLSLWILADAGVRGLNSVSEDEYHLDREKDKNGKIRRITFDTPVFGISAPIRKSDKAQ